MPLSILYDNLIVAELSCAFTYLMYTLANPKYSLKTHVLIHFLTTVAFLAVKNLVNGAALQYGMETVLWMLLGCLLISPLLVFYGGNWIFGHKTGDLYLIHFAQALERLCDDQTFFFRKSGDEFICLSRNAELSHQLRTLQPKMDPGIFFQGFSFGCAQMPEDGVTLAELMDAADRNMYVHKQNRHHFSFGGKSSVGR